MAVTLPEVLKRGVNPQLAMIAKEIVTTDEFAAVVPIEPIAGTSIKIPREGSLPDAEFISDAGTTTENSNAEDDVPEVQFRRVVGNFDIDKLAMEVGGSHSGSISRQTAAKAKATWRLLKSKMIAGGHVTSHTLSPATAPFTAILTWDYGPYLDSARRGPGSLRYTHAGTLWQFRAPGDIDYGEAVAVAADATVTLRSYNKSFYVTVNIDVSVALADGETMIRFASTTNEFDGLNEQIDPARLIDPTAANGDAFSLAMLDKLISNEKVRSNRHFMMNSALIEKFYAAYRALSAVDPQTVSLPGYTGLVPVYRGIPLLENDNILSNETVGSTTDASSLYLASLSYEEGFFLAAASTGGLEGALNVDSDPRNQPVLGFRIEDIQTLEGKDAMRRRVKFYGAPVLRSTLAAVRRRGVITA